MTYILTIILGLHSISAPFEDKAACDRALEIVMQDGFYRNLPTKPACEPKGE